MNEKLQNKVPLEEKTKGGVIKYFFWLLVIMILAGAFCFVYLANSFRPKHVIKGFQKYCEIRIQSNEGNILEVAVGNELVELTRNSAIEIFSKIVPVHSSKIIVPATFRYHIDLNGNWSMIEDGKRLHVIAPPLIPSLPVAFNTQEMVKENPSVWSKISGSNMEELEKTLTPELEVRASDPENIAKYQSAAKKSIAKFLQNWLVMEGEWDAGRFEEIVVYFDPEIVDPSKQNLVPDASYHLPEPVLN